MNGIYLEKMTEKMTASQRAILNSFVVGGISFFASLSTTGGIPTTENIWTGLVAGILACLIRIKDFLDNPPQEESDLSSNPNSTQKDFKIGMLI